MAKNKKVSDTEVVAALIEQGSVAKAAEAVGLAPRTLYDRLNDKDFVIIYREARTDVMRSAVLMLNKRVVEAIETVAAIQADTSVNPAIRLQAAQTLIKNAAAFNGFLGTVEDENRETSSPLTMFL